MSDPRTPLGRDAASRKARPGATRAAETPVEISARGARVDDALRAHIGTRLGRQLGRRALAVERCLVRFVDVNGPRGGRDKLCRLTVVLTGSPNVFVEERAETERSAFDRAAKRAARAAFRSLDRSTLRTARRDPATALQVRDASQVDASEAALPDEGSLIGRRVGRSAENLARALDRPEKRRRDVPVNTAKPGVSASDRKAGGTSTARRNAKANRAGMIATLEDSASGRPSRKPTRRSANRAKQGTALATRQLSRTASPKTRATRSRDRS
jgi:hypothetical protein